MIVNAPRKKKAPNPLRVDPTRTASLRRAFERQLRVRFERLRAKLKALLVDEDAFGLDSSARDHPFGPFVSRNYLYVNCGGQGSGVPGPCPSGVTPDEANKGRSFTNRLKALGTKAGEVEHALKDQIASKIALLPRPLQTGLSVLYHTAFAGWTASQALAEAVAVERGSTPEQARRLRGVLAAVDIAAFKPVAIGLSASGVGTGVQALTWVVPPATGAYLAYSTARSPIKTAKAALKLVRDSLRSAAGGLLDKVSVMPQGVGNVEASLTELMADALEAHDYDDWYIAIFTQAISLDLSPQEAVALADELWKDSTPPWGEDIDSDAEELFGKKGLTANAGRWQFASDPEKVRQFKAWLRREMEGELTSRSERELWEAYTKLGLQKGAGRAFDDTRRPQRVAAELSGKSDFYLGSRDEFLRSAFNRPVAIEKVQLLASRSFDELENVTTATATRMTRHLTDGLVKGDSPRDIARDLDRDLDIGENRSLVIARTEIVRAHAEGQLMALEELGVEEVGVVVEWSTAGDDHVCELCQPLEGVVLKIDEAKGMLPRHPNCRCAWLPANVGEDSKDQKDTKSSIGRALDISVEREGGEESRWVGADLTPARDRPQSLVGNEDYLSAFSRALGKIKEVR